MTTKDIIYLKSTDPITLLDEPPMPKTIEMVAFFQSNPTTSAMISAIRKQYGFPEKGLDIKPFIGKKLIGATNAGIETIVWSLYLAIDSMKQSLGVNDSFVDQFALLICFNACIDLRYFTGFISQPIQFVITKKNIASTMFEYPHEIGAILIPYVTSQNQLVKWIENNWKDIEKQMDLPETLFQNPFSLRIHKNTVITSEIIDLKDNQKKTFSKIANELTDKYPTDQRVTKEEWVKDTYYFFKDRIMKSAQPNLKK
jgi:hypothetical protein